MRMRAGVQHHTATRACKPAASALLIKTVAGNSCESGRVQHPPDRECSRVANAWWNYIVSHAQGFTGFLVATREHSEESRFDANAGRTTSGAMGFDPPLPGNRQWQNVLPSLVAFVLMSRCECRWNYRLLISWSRVRSTQGVGRAEGAGRRPSAKREQFHRSQISGTVAQSGRARSFHQPLSQRGTIFAVNADGTTGGRTRWLLEGRRVPYAAMRGAPGSETRSSNGWRRNVSSILVTVLLCEMK